MLLFIVIACALINQSSANIKWYEHKMQHFDAESLGACALNLELIMTYTTDGYTSDSRPCLNDCKFGYCVTSLSTCERCTAGRGGRTYHTSQYREPSHTRCMSRCGYFGRPYTWCVVSIRSGFVSWDYCNADIEKRIVPVQFTAKWGLCKSECDYSGENYLWCNTYWSGLFDSWDYCSRTRYNISQVTTARGYQCRGECLKHEGKKYFWCYNSDQEQDLCAPTAD